MSDGSGWQRLDPRTVWASTIVIAGSLLGAAAPLALALAVARVGTGWILLWCLGGTLVGALGISAFEAVRLAVTRYRVAGHRIERRVTLIGSTTKALSVQRIRNVEVAADLVQRRLGIAEVRLASGDADGPRFSLVTLDRDDAEALRRQLLGARATADTTTLAEHDWSLLRYAPVSVLTPVFGLVAFAFAFQVADWFALVPEMLDWVVGAVRDTSWWLVVLTLVVTALLIGTVTSLVAHIEAWWGYRLEHQQDGSLDLHRGLLIGRATHFDGRRVRGVRVHEPPGLRLVRAARLDIIAVGVRAGSTESNRTRQSPTLVPNAPRELVTSVGQTVLGADWPDGLQAHPPAARSRRFVRAGLVTVGCVLASLMPALVWSSLWWLSPMTLIVAAPVSAGIAHDNARGLGHRSCREHVVLRKGSLLRRTDVLQRDGLLGWNLRQSPLQRPAGVVTLVATSAGGSGAFRLPDTSEAQAASLLAMAGPVWDHLRVGGFATDLTST